jgi:hypothetical protein
MVPDDGYQVGSAVLLIEDLEEIIVCYVNRLLITTEQDEIRRAEFRIRVDFSVPDFRKGIYPFVGETMGVA